MPQQPAGARDLEAAEPPARAQDPREFPKPVLEVGDVPDPEADGDDVEASVREWEREGVSLDPLDRRGLAPRPGKHLRGEVEPRDLAARPLVRERKVSGTAADVEHAVAWPDDGLGGGSAPAAVEPGAHRPVHGVVDGRDPVEHRPHLPCAENAGGHSPHRVTRSCSMLNWSRHLPTTKLIRSSTVSGAW